MVQKWYSVNAPPGRRGVDNRIGTWATSSTAERRAFNSRVFGSNPKWLSTGEEALVASPDSSSKSEVVRGDLPPPMSFAEWCNGSTPGFELGRFRFESWLRSSGGGHFLLPLRIPHLSPQVTAARLCGRCFVKGQIPSSDFSANARTSRSPTRAGSAGIRYGVSISSPRSHG